ncbi:MAG: DUF4199 domain-containing protein [Bacteroidetes bacterium]|nr:DUF4199 domain-containing protein [Bacteroidota bacterium]
MENEKSPLISASLKYGLIITLALAIFSLVLYMLDMSTNSKVNWISYLILISAVSWSIKEYRDKSMGGIISYSQALGAGTMISLFTALFYAVFTYMFFTLIAPDMIEEMRLQSEEALIASGASDDEIEMAMKISNRFVSPVGLSLIVVVIFTFVGFITSLIAAAVFKKD